MNVDIGYVVIAGVSGLAIGVYIGAVAVCYIIERIVTKFSAECLKED